MAGLIAPGGRPSQRWSRFCMVGFAVLLLTLCGDRARGEQPTSAKKEQRTPLQVALERGHASLAAGDYAKAKASFDTAFLLGDESPAVFGDLGAARIGLGDIDRGIAELEEAIRRNPGDLGQKYHANAAVALSKAALQHGEEQVRKMLKDRPAMAQHLARFA
jgi:tetratricopeptide (TPR) repeat protein